MPRAVRAWRLAGAVFGMPAGAPTTPRPGARVARRRRSIAGPRRTNPGVKSVSGRSGTDRPSPASADTGAGTERRH